LSQRWTSWNRNASTALTVPRCVAEIGTQKANRPDYEPPRLLVRKYQRKKRAGGCSRLGSKVTEVVVHRMCGLLIEGWWYLCRANNVPPLRPRLRQVFSLQEGLSTTLSLAIAQEVEWS